MTRTPIGQISDEEFSGPDCVIRESKRARTSKLHPMTDEYRQVLVKRIRTELRYIDRVRRAEPNFMWSRGKALGQELRTLEGMRAEVAA
ncbi:hypothetical protein ACEN19_11095 [Corynebacterium auriscanis]|uniref:hypothetical protein n=1 Tax=Corynebacterium auriscanis TaxID=99807 RepID=UPI003CF89D05